MDEKELQEIEARAEDATPGPWIGDRRDGTVKYILYGANGEYVVYGNDDYGIMHDFDEEFIKHARTDIPALIAALRDARKEIYTASELYKQTRTARDEANTAWTASIIERDDAQEKLKANQSSTENIISRAAEYINDNARLRGVISEAANHLSIGILALLDFDSLKIAAAKMRGGLIDIGNIAGVAPDAGINDIVAMCKEVKDDLNKLERENQTLVDIIHAAGFELYQEGEQVGLKLVNDGTIYMPKGSENGK